MIWQCDDCDLVIECDPVCGDDWPDGILRPVGPNCPVCDQRMGYIGWAYDTRGRVIEEEEHNAS